MRTPCPDTRSGLLSREEENLRRYETIFIVPADLPEDETNALIDRYRSLIVKNKGMVVKVEKWGKRKLAYEIKKQIRGFYVLMDLVSEHAAITELERNFKIDDKILKFMTVKKADQVDLAEIEKEIAAAAAPPATADGGAKEAPLEIVKAEEVKGGGEQ
jgi:small subunit ribosomal protein S6